jgi:hypothetical protein
MSHPIQSCSHIFLLPRLIWLWSSLTNDYVEECRRYMDFHIRPFGTLYFNQLWLRLRAQVLWSTITQNCFWQEEPRSIFTKWNRSKHWDVAASSTVTLGSNKRERRCIIICCYCDQPVAATNDRVPSHEPVATQDHNSDRRSVISSEPVATKGHNSWARRLVPPRSQKVRLTNINTCLQRNHRAVLTDIWEVIFMYLWASPFNYL